MNQFKFLFSVVLLVLSIQGNAQEVQVLQKSINTIVSLEQLSRQCSNQLYFETDSLEVERIVMQFRSALSKLETESNPQTALPLQNSAHELVMTVQDLANTPFLVYINQFHRQNYSTEDQLIFLTKRIEVYSILDSLNNDFKRERKAYVEHYQLRDTFPVIEFFSHQSKNILKTQLKQLEIAQQLAIVLKAMNERNTFAFSNANTVLDNLLINNRLYGDSLLERSEFKFYFEFVEAYCTHLEQFSRIHFPKMATLLAKEELSEEEIASFNTQIHRLNELGTWYKQENEKNQYKVMELMMALSEK